MRISVSDSTPTSHTMATSTATSTSAVTTSAVTTVISSSGTPTTSTNGHTVSLAPTNTKPPRDSSWLELEVCREYYQRQNCPRSYEECRYAHPEPRFMVRDGKVTCCYDFLKNRCRRDQCKFFHPPTHIKQQLISAGKQFGAMMSNMYLMPGGSYYPPIPTVAPSTVPVIGANGQIINSAPSPAFVPAAVMSPYGMMTDRLHVCPEFLRGQCVVPLCPFVHPESQVRCNFDSTVTICRDFVRGGCQRPHCRYFHPPPHIATQIADVSAMAGFMNQAPSPGLMMSPTMVPQVFPPIVYPIAPASIAVPVTPAPIPTSVVPIFPTISSAVPLPVLPITLPSPEPTTTMVPVSVSVESPPSPDHSFTNGYCENSTIESVVLQ